MNHIYNNPVVHTFVRLLSKSSSHYHASPLSVGEMSMRLMDHCDFKYYGGSTSELICVHYNDTRVERTIKPLKKNTQVTLEMTLTWIESYTVGYL
jgi:hypothetical protein